MWFLRVLWHLVADKLMLKGADPLFLCYIYSLAKAYMLHGLPVKQKIIQHKVVIINCFMMLSGGWAQESWHQMKEEAAVQSHVYFGRWQQVEQAAAGRGCCLFAWSGFLAKLQECHFSPALVIVNNTVSGGSVAAVHGSLLSICGNAVVGVAYVVNRMWLNTQPGGVPALSTWVKIIHGHFGEQIQH